VSCALTCDGKGPVVGGSQTMRFDLPSTMPSGSRLGVALRARGNGHVSLHVLLDGDLPFPVGETSVDATTLADVIVQASPLPSVGGGTTRPTAIELVTDSDTQIEIDCLVPFVTE
jgi:hypothetical protein